MAKLTLVTGANGFVGAAVVRRLLTAGHQVRALVRADSDTANLKGLSLERALGDLTDRASLDKALEGCRYLFHVAALYRLWHPRPAAFYAANVEGTRNLMCAAQEQGLERIVYTSSVATLGLPVDGSPGDEDTPVSLKDMIGHYKRSKYLAEELVREQVQSQGLQAVIVNPAAPIGPRDRKPTPTGRMILDAAAGRMPAYVDTGLNVLHVDDAAQGHLAALERGRIGERYILGSENMSMKAILEQVAAITGGRPPRFKLAASWILPLAHLAQAWARVTRGPEPRMTVDGVKLARKRMFFSCAKAQRELDYQPRPALDALRDAIEWFEREGYLARSAARSKAGSHGPSEETP